MTTTTHRPTVTARVAKGAETNLSRMVAADRERAARLAFEAGHDDPESVIAALAAAPTDPAVIARRDAIAAHGRATTLADGARLTALAHADVIDWERLPQSPAYRAMTRNWLDAVCERLEKLHAACSLTAQTFDHKAHPIAHTHYRNAADAAWRERMVWAVLRDDVLRAGR